MDTHGRWRRLLSLIRSEDGPTGAEYAILLSLLVLSSMTIIGSVGSKMQVIWERIRDGVAVAAG